MKQIHSAGKEWLFVPVPVTCTEPKIVGNVTKRLRDIDDSHGGWFNSDVLPPGDWTILSTLSEALSNEELAKEMVEKDGDLYVDYVLFRGHLQNYFDNAVESLQSFIKHHSIDPTTHWLILKKEG